MMMMIMVGVVKLNQEISRSIVEGMQQTVNVNFVVLHEQEQVVFLLSLRFWFIVFLMF